MVKAIIKSFLLWFLSSFTICSSENLVGFYYDARTNTSVASTANIESILKETKSAASELRVLVSDRRLLDRLSKTGASVDLYLNYAEIKHLWTLKPSELGLLKSNFRSGNIKSVTLTSGFDCWLPVRTELRLVLSSLRATLLFLEGLQLQDQVKVSAAFQFSFLEKWSSKQIGDLVRIFNFLKKAKSYVTIEVVPDVDRMLGSEVPIINEASNFSSLLLDSYVPIFFIVTSSKGIPSHGGTGNFNQQIMKSLGFDHSVKGKIIGLLTELAHEGNSSVKGLVNKDPRALRRELLSDLYPSITSHDTFDPPTRSFPTDPGTNPTPTLSNFPVYTPTPNIVTVPGANPATFAPTNPAALPVTAPPDTPTNPAALPVTTPPDTSFPTPSTNSPPIPNPSTPIADPVGPPTNPATAFPPPAGDTPVTDPVPPPVGDIPVTNPMTPPAATNAPDISGQSWCIAKSGVSQAELQGALDYACGNGADCSMIQQGAGCYDPNTLENHASFAFNSYYQKSPTPDSCDFGGTAVLVNTNPSTGSCVYPSSATAAPLSTGPPAITPSTVPPVTTASPSYTIPPPTTSVPFGSTEPPVTGSGSYVPPSGSNVSNPASDSPLVFGSQGAPDFNTTTSGSIKLRALLDNIVMIVLVALIVLGL